MKAIQGMAPAGAGLSHSATGQGGIAQSKWTILKTIEDIREPLGLNGTSISLLRAMISFLRMDHIAGTRDEGHICFASNATLSKRAHVSIQTVERHITKLVSLGLLTRRASGNGKRWARRDREGNIVFATGLSLLPLATRFPEFVLMSQSVQDLKTELQRLRDLCAESLIKLKSHLLQTASNAELLSRARNILRRQPEKTVLTDLLTEIAVEISNITSREPDELRGTDPEIEGHKETSMTQLVKEKTIERTEVSQDEMERAFPRLCVELRFARNQDDCRNKMDSLAQQLCLGNTWLTIKEFGPARSFMILGYLLERIEKIRNFRGYAFKLAQDLSSDDIDWRSLLKRPRERLICED